MGCTSDDLPTGKKKGGLPKRGTRPEESPIASPGLATRDLLRPGVDLGLLALLLLLRHLRVFLVADVVEVEPADVHLINRSRTAGHERCRIGVFLVARRVVVVRDRVPHRAP